MRDIEEYDVCNERPMYRALQVATREEPFLDGLAGERT